MVSLQRRKSPLMSPQMGLPWKKEPRGTRVGIVTGRRGENPTKPATAQPEPEEVKSGGDDRQFSPPSWLDGGMW